MAPGMLKVRMLSARQAITLTGCVRTITPEPSGSPCFPIDLVLISKASDDRVACCWLILARTATLQLA